MTKNNTIKNLDKALKEIAYDMSVLLVEDDILLQEQMKLMLARFFASVDTASNGEDALEKYKHKKYDLIVSDITMPRMNGIVLSEKIKELNETQKIIVISAHSESDKLIELINIGVDGFLLKPIDIVQMMTQLSKNCYAIYDQRMLKYFSEMIEETNQELRKSNIALENALNEIMYCKSHGEHRLPKASKEGAATKISKNDFYVLHHFEIDNMNKALENLEYSFSLLLLNTEKQVKVEMLHTLTDIMHQYALFIENFDEFENIQNAMHTLEIYLFSRKEPLELSSFLPHITNLFDDLENWRKGLFEYKNMDDIYSMDTRIIQRITEIIEI